MASEQYEGIKLKFLVQNVWCHYAPHCSSPQKLERMTAFKDFLEGNEVLLLQELFTGRGIGVELHQGIIQFAADHGLPHAAQPRIPMLGQNSGLLILSKYQLYRQQERDWGSFLELFPTKKGFLAADIAVSPQFSLTVITLHLNAHIPSNRAEQLLGLAELVESGRSLKRTSPSCADLPHWFAIGGDFNICAWSQPEEHANLIAIMQTRLGLYDVFQHLSGDASGEGRQATCDNGLRIDYFWTNIPPEYLKSSANSYLHGANNDLKLSDHQALQVVFDLPFQSYDDLIAQQL